LDQETGLDAEVKGWLAFAVQKISELTTLSHALTDGRAAVKASLMASTDAVARRKTSARIYRTEVSNRIAAITPDMLRRRSGFEERRRIQHARLSLPAFPTTTIGSFPQTDEVRKARTAHLRGSMNDTDYTDFLRRQTEAAVRWQEEIGLDVLVHGEFERNDMVQYFGEQL